MIKDIMNGFINLFDSEKTKINYKIDLSEFVEYIKSQKVSYNKVTPMVVANYNEKLVQHGLADTTRARKISTIKSFYRFLFTNNLIEKDISDDIKLPKIDKDKAVSYLSEEDAKVLLSVINGKHALRDKTIVLLFLTCGLRVSELHKLNKSNIIGNSLEIVKGKGNKSRIVQLNEQTLDMINKYLEVVPYSDGDALFVSQKGNRLAVTTIQGMIKKYVRMAKLDDDISAHSLRHTNATLMLKNGVDTKVIQEILGHSSLATTQKYLHINNEDKQKAVDSIQF